MTVRDKDGVDWQRVGEEAAGVLRRYLRIDTTNPPGNEARAAELLAQELRERGFSPNVYRSAPDRANVLARLSGSGEKGPVLLLHHMDVVLADQKRWSHDPFGGEMEDGFIYGRGALDMKGLGVMHLLALDLLRRSGRPLQRDVILLAVADEEMEGAYGTGWMVDHHWGEIHPDVVWDEGGFGLEGAFGDGLIFHVAVAEKQVLWPRLVAEGEAGLASLPRGKNPIDGLSQALARIRRWRQPPRLTKVTREMLHRLADAVEFPRSFLLRHAEHPAVWAVLRRALTADPMTNAMVRNLVTTTTLRAGEKENVIPSRAEAGLDVRLLPDEDPEAFIADLQALVEGDGVQVKLNQQPVRSSISPFHSPFFNALERVLRRNVRGCGVVPTQTPGGTDSRFFRRKGVPSYGLIPVAIDTKELQGMHGVNERISLDNLTLGTRVVYEVLQEICC